MNQEEIYKSFILMPQHFIQEYILNFIQITFITIMSDHITGIQDLDIIIYIGLLDSIPYIDGDHFMHNFFIN